MKTRKIIESDLPKLIKFNQKMFFKRNKIDESLSYRLLRNPFRGNEFKSLISIDNDNSIIGQILLMPSQFGFKGKTYNAYWGMDYIVDNDYRGTIAGTNLCKKATKEDYHFGVGLSEISLKMHLIFKEQIIGHLNKYVRFNNILSVFKFLFKTKENKNYIFPDKLKIKNDLVFHKVNNASELNSKDYWNDKLIEFSRNKSFIKWRYFYYEKKFSVYKLVDLKRKTNAYFVVRPYFWKDTNCLLLVDYRFSNHKNFNNILSAIKIISKKNKIAATIMGSSLPSLNKILKSNFYFKFGKKADIVTNFRECFSWDYSSIDKIMLTFADSDFEHYRGNNKW